MTFKVSRLLRAAVCCCAWLIPTAHAQVSPFQIQFRMVSWTPPTTNDDGSPLTDLAGYYIYHGTSPDTMVPQYFSTADEPQMLLVYPFGGVHYYAVSAVNVDGVESALTPIVSQ